MNHSRNLHRFIVRSLGNCPKIASDGKLFHTRSGSCFHRRDKSQDKLYRQIPSRTATTNYTLAFSSFFSTLYICEHLHTQRL